jgi:outer membrane protein assembly factor BamB
MRNGVVGAFFLAGLLALNISGANDWPQWQGPHRNGISEEKGLLQDWPSGGPKLLWKAQGLGNGYATVITSGDKIFTLGERASDSQIIALNRADGSELWRAKVGRSGERGGYRGPRSTPSTDGQLVFGVGIGGELACVDAKTGQEKWHKDFSQFGGSEPGWGFAESALIDGDKLIATPGGSKGAIIALNKNTGEMIWQSTGFTDPAHYSSVMPADIFDVHQYVQLTAQDVVGIKADDGHVLWKAPRRGATAVIPTPLVWDNFVYVTSGYGVGCNLFEVKNSGGQFSADQVYASKVMQNHHGGVIRVGEYIYGYSEGKGWTCQKFKTGEAVWQERKLDKGSLVYADNRLYLRAEAGKGTVALIEATPDGYREHGRFDQPDRHDDHSWAHPVVSDGKLYLRDGDILLCYDVKKK